MPHDWILGLLGGVMMGVGCLTLVLFNGKILGVSGLLGGALKRGSDTGWRWAFLGGMVAAGVGALLAYPSAFDWGTHRSTGATLVGAVLVGAGTQLGNGCTSGHGICGMGRLSVRSIVATCVFMATAAASVFVIEHLLGGAV